MEEPEPDVDDDAVQLVNVLFDDGVAAAAHGGVAITEAEAVQNVYE